ncbi:MAG: type II toxin-antitoxin system antitoxin SocA domain-containing protein [Bacteroidota bacterium]
MYRAVDIANWFIQRNLEFECPIANLKVQKLLYYAQGFYLALHNEKLFEEELKFWEQGPVVEEVFHALKHNESGPVQSLIQAANLPKEDGSYGFDEDLKSLLEEIQEIYGQYSPWRLKEMTHDERPCKKAMGSSEPICTDSMKEFFENYIH